MGKKLLHTYSIFFLTFSLFCHSQNNLIVGVNAHYGFIWAHHPEIQYVIKGHIPAFEINIARPTYGEKTWQQKYHYPEAGVCFLHVDLANPDVLGTAEAVYAYLNFPLIYKKKFTLNFRAGDGIGYLTKKFDRVENHKNMVIGSHFNGAVNLRLNAKIYFSDHFVMEAGVGMTHFSNGSFALPNFGLNIPTANIGASYLFGNKREKIVGDSIVPINKKVQYSIFLVGGVTQLDPPGSPKYFAYSVSFNVGKNLGYKSRFNAAIDVFYNPANLKKFEGDSVVLSNNLENAQVGIKIGHELVISKLSIPIEMGAFVLTKFKGNGYFYHRIGIRYKITKHIVLNYTLKTFWAKADYFEFGGAYQF